MMNQIQASSTTAASKTHKQKKCCEASMPPPEIKKIESRVKKKKKQQKSRDPFQHLRNRDGIGSTADSTASNTSSISSTEASKCCLRFFLSHSSSSSVKSPCNNSNYLGLRKNRTFASKTPKSAPNVRPARGNSLKRTVYQDPISQKLEKGKRNPPPCFYHRHSGKKPSRNAARSKLSSALGSGSSHGNKLRAAGLGESKQIVVDGVYSDATNLTPLRKFPSGSALNVAADGKALVHRDDEISNADMNTNSAGSNTKTPPVQVSVSPEIQCGSTMASTTTAIKTSPPACYSAGHVLSGIIDKRKCRSRGLLTVGEAKALDNFDGDEDTDQDNALGLANNSSVSMLLLPAEASMHWLPSPCNEEDRDQKENSEQLYYRQRLEECSIDNCPAPPPPFGSGLSSYMCNSIAKEEDRKNHCNLDGKSSPFSVDSLDDENVIQTPQSDSSSERRVAMSLFGENKQDLNSELYLVAEDLRMASLSPESHASIWNPSSLSFQFESLATPSNSVDLSRFQKVLDGRASWLSNSALDNASQSQMRISWREGLVRPSFEMDEIDCCRCLSDKEDDDPCCNNDSLKPAQSPEHDNVTDGHVPSNGFGSTEFLVDGNAKEGAPSQVPFSCVESISTDGGGLVRSEDSDWAECYKNQLFGL